MSEKGPFARIKARELARLSEKEKRRAILEESANPSQSVSAVMDSLHHLKEKISSQLDQFKKSPEKSILAAAQELLLQMKHKLAESSAFLPVYETRQGQKLLDELQFRFNQAASLESKWQFSFKSSGMYIEQETGDEKVIQSDQHLVGESIMEKKASRSIPEQSLADLHSVTVVRQQGIVGGDFLLEECSDCTIFVMEVYSALHVINLENCKVYCAPVNGSIFLESCRSCEFSLASRQIRIHNSRDCDFWLQVRSNPIIEDSNGLEFGPFNFRFSNLKVFMKYCGFDSDFNTWSSVNDFSWLKGQQSPNWRVMDLRKQSVVVNYAPDES